LLRGLSTLTLDAKGRMAVPSRYRARLQASDEGRLVATINTLDRCLLLYPLNEWEIIEAKLRLLSDFDALGRRTKQMMIGHATDCEMDGHGRVLLSQMLRDYAGLDRHIVMVGQGNKFELWDEPAWTRQREEWLAKVGDEVTELSDDLKSLSL